MPYCPQGSGALTEQQAEQTAGLRRFKKGIITVLVVLLLAVYAWRIYYHDPLLSIDPSLGRVLQWFYLN